MRDPFTGQYMTAEEQAHEEALIAKEAAEFWQGFSERLSAVQAEDGKVIDV
jgi:hypothetical protein